MAKLKIYTLLSLLTFLFFSCKNNSDNTNSWNKGKITVAADIHLQPIFDQLKPVFENANKEAEVNLNYQIEDSILLGFKNGKYTSVLISRLMTDAEKKEAELKQETKIVEMPFAYDAIAIITHPDFTDSVISLNKLNEYLQPTSARKLVFDNPKSGIAKQVQSLTKIPIANFKNAFTLNNTDEVIAYVQQHKNAIGFIPFNIFSTSIQSKRNLAVKLLSIQLNDTIHTLTQYDLSLQKYPLMRTLNFVLGRNPEQVANGFAHFLNSQKTAKILLKSGLVPRFLPVRNIVVQDELKTK